MPLSLQSIGSSIANYYRGRANNYVANKNTTPEVSASGCSFFVPGKVGDGGVDAPLTDAPPDMMPDVLIDRLPDGLIDGIQDDAATDAIQDDAGTDAIQEDAIQQDAIQEDAQQTDAIQDDAPPQTDGPLCISQSMLETAFTTGISVGLDTLSKPGSISLDRNWTYRYNANSGILPDASGWTLVKPGSGTTELINDPVSGEMALHINSMGANNRLYYQIDPSFNNATGWVVAWRSRVASVEPGANRNSACAIDIIDTVKWMEFGMVETKIVDAIALQDLYIMDTVSAMHDYRIEAKGATYSVYVDNTPVPGSPFTFGGGDVLNRILWGDLAVTEDSDSYWVFFRYYNGGNIANYVSPGTYESKVYDLGAAVNNIGTGATITFQGDSPLSTTIAYQTRTGNVNPPDASWTSWTSPLTTISINSPSLITSLTGRYIQARTNLSTSTVTFTPRVDDFTFNYCQY